MTPARIPEKKAGWKTAGMISVSSLIAAVTALGTVQRMIYTRTEGRTLERRIEVLERNYREDVKEIRERLDAIFVQMIKRR